MLNPINFISKLFKSSNEKELARIEKVVRKINLLEESFKKLEALHSRLPYRDRMQKHWENKRI